MAADSVDPAAFGLGDRTGLSSAFALSPLILCVTGAADGRLRDVNEAFLRATGYTRDELIGRRMDDLGLWIDPEIRALGLATLREGRAVRDTEARFRTKTGVEVVAILAADAITLDGEACILTAAMDISDRVRAEDALRESEQRFLRAFHANPLPMTITSLPEGRHLVVNDAAVRHGGYAREELLGRTKVELGFCVAPEQRERMLRLLHEHGRVRDLEVTFRTKDGEERNLLVNSEVIVFSGKPAVLNVSLDITERKHLEAESRARRREAEELAGALQAANRAKDEFFAMLGHELRNPLGAIRNAVAVLESVADDPTVRQATAVIGRQTSHLTRLVEDLLDVARATSGKIALKVESVDLYELAGHCVGALARAERTHGLDVSFDGESVRVEGDPTRLDQVISREASGRAARWNRGGLERRSGQRERIHGPSAGPRRGAAWAGTRRRSARAPLPAAGARRGGRRRRPRDAAHVPRARGPRGRGMRRRQERARAAPRVPAGDCAD
jgi:PAS domain S-box-containing protein